MLEPVYLHWDGSYETYHAFFTHLRCKLDNINNCFLMVLTHQHRAIMKYVRAKSVKLHTPIELSKLAIKTSQTAKAIHKMVTYIALHLYNNAT